MTRPTRLFHRLALPRDPLLRLLVINGCAGAAVAALVLTGIFLGNIGNLRVLVVSAEDPVVPVVMLALGLLITLGSVVMGSAIMLVGRDEVGRGRPGRRMPGLAGLLRAEPALKPVSARASRPRG